MKNNKMLWVGKVLMVDLILMLVGLVLGILLILVYVEFLVGIVVGGCFGMSVVVIGVLFIFGLFFLLLLNVVMD